MTAAPVMEALNMAARTCRHSTLDGPTCHTDAGSQPAFLPWKRSAHRVGTATARCTAYQEAEPP